MNIFVINSGSSSLKYQLFHSNAEDPLCSGLVERIGQKGSRITHKFLKNGKEEILTLDHPVPNHESGLDTIAKLLTQPNIAVIHGPGDIDVIGHRIVHGGETLTKTTLITDEVKQKIKALFPMAPLHNPGNLMGIAVTEKIFPKAIQVAAFDTAFHQTLPEYAFRYAVPGSFYSDFGIRVYGFHGISHQYVSRKAAEYLGKPGAKLITIHLGNGCSMAAVDGGKCIDTSMGLTPLDGLIMGTRSGIIDPSVLIYLMKEKNFGAAQLETLLNRESGMLGLTGHNDMRDISKMREDGDTSARLAYDMYAYRIKKFIGAYAASMNGLDAIVFTAGVGENDPVTRELACCDMDYFGIQLDQEKNLMKTTGVSDIAMDGSRCRVLVVPTNEELEIARQCLQLISENS